MLSDHGFTDIRSEVYLNRWLQENGFLSFTTDQPKGVGEESLEAEIRNWFELAKSRKESLRITLGRLNEQKLLTYYDQPPSKPERV